MDSSRFIVDIVSPLLLLIHLGWLDPSDEKNCNGYVTGLSLDFIDVEFEEMMDKYGVISPDPIDPQKKSIRLYRDAQGHMSKAMDNVDTFQ